jgi:YD repeat-containing protein
MTYTYDSYTDNSNPSNPNQVFGGWGYVAAVVMGDPTHQTACGPTGYSGQQFTQMFNYSSSGKVLTKRLEMTQTTAYPPAQAWDVNYTYDTLGRLVSTQYPGAVSYTAGPVAGIKYTVGYDAVDRPITLTYSYGAHIV